MGYSSLAVARSGGAWAVASETSAFPNLGFTVEKYLEPGEIVLIDESGIRAAAGGRGVANNICAFLWIYTGFPTSSYEGINVETVRERCGQRLARRDRDIEVDVVAGIPDSGIGHALGYSMESREAVPAAAREVHAGVRAQLYAPFAGDARPRREDEAHPERGDHQRATAS